MGCGSSTNKIKVVITAPSSTHENNFKRSHGPDSKQERPKQKNNDISNRPRNEVGTNVPAVTNIQNVQSYNAKVLVKDNNDLKSNNPTKNRDIAAEEHLKTKNKPEEKHDVSNGHHAENEKEKLAEFYPKCENLSNGLLETGERDYAFNNSLHKEKSKDQLFSVSDFRDVDLYAVEAPNGCKDSFRALANYLTSPFDSELMKFRAIWKWVTTNIEYDTEQFFSQDRERVSDVDILRSGKGVCDGYASVVMELCRYSEIEIKKITGYAKGFHYRPGDKIKGTKTNHAWNAVNIQGQWWLCDFTWGAGYVGKDKNFVWNYTEHYFLTDPEEFVLDHFPSKSEWQLLNPCYTIEQFEKWAKFYKHFFIYQLKPLTHKEGIIEAIHGEVQVALETKIPVDVSCKLVHSMQDKAKDMIQYCFHYQTENKAIFQARLPILGKYELKLFSKQASSDGVKSYDSVVSYIIQCNEVSSCQKFPKTFSTWIDGFILHEPNCGILQTNKSINFNITAPRIVTEMVVCVTGGEGEWLLLSLKEKGVWKGELTFNSSAEVANVVVKLAGQTSTTYSSILKYIIQEEMLKL